VIKDDMVITHVKYRDSSRNANPRYWVTFSDNTTTSTEVDGSVGYGITNPEFQGVPLRVEFNRKGSIVHVQTMDGKFWA
jgi:hypothetical protein